MKDFWRKARKVEMGGAPLLALILFLLFFVLPWLFFGLPGDIERWKESRKAKAQQEEEAELAKEKADRVRSLGIPDSVQGIAGLELPNVSFDVGRELSLGGRMWKYERRNPAYEILLTSIKGDRSAVDEGFSEANKLASSLWKSLYQNATFKGQDSYGHTPGGASAGRVHSATYWEPGGKGSIYMYVFHDGNTLWTITFKGSDEVKEFAEAFMARVKVL